LNSRHAGSTKSHEFIRENNEPAGISDYIPFREEITTEYGEGENKDIRLHDGSILRLGKLAQNHDPFNRIDAINFIQKRQQSGEVPTGLFYVDPDEPDFHDISETVRKPLGQLTETDLCPGNNELKKINTAFR